MSYSLSPLLKPRFFVNATNKPLVGGKLYTYLAETTTPATTYSNDTGTPNTNPIVLDANGECNLYLNDDVSYRLILKDANDVTYFDKDRVSSIGGGDYKVLTFNTIDDLRLKIGSSKEPVAQTSGYYAAGDGGGNRFYWDGTSGATDNGGTIIKPTFVSGAGRWLAINADAVNVRWFGAKGNGLNDDTNSINSAAVFAASIGATLFLDAGRFLITQPIDVNVNVNGLSAAILTLGSSNFDAFRVTTKNNITIENLKFERVGTNIQRGKAIAIRGKLENINIVNVTTDGYGSGVYFDGDNGVLSNAKYSVSISNTSVGGTWNIGIYPPISYSENKWTSALAYNITAAELQAELNAKFGSGNITVTGGNAPANAFILEFTGAFSGLPVQRPVMAFGLSVTESYGGSVSMIQEGGSSLVNNVTLDRVNIKNSGEYGVEANNLRGLKLINSTATGSWFDGVKLRKNVHNVQIIGGDYSENGTAWFVVGTNQETGDGIDCYAGGELISIVGARFNNNNGAGLQIKNDDSTDLSGYGTGKYGINRKIELIGIEASYNTVASGITLTTNKSVDTSYSVSDVTVTGGLFEGNATYGILAQGYRITLNGAKTRRNGIAGILVPLGSKQVEVNNCVSVANGNGNGNGFGLVIAGKNITVNGGFYCGVDGESATNATDFNLLTKYHLSNIRIEATASDVFINMPDESYNVSGRGIAIQSAAGVFPPNIKIWQRPTELGLIGGSSLLSGSVGSMFFKRDATQAADQVFIKVTGDSGSVGTWRRLSGSSLKQYDASATMSGNDNVVIVTCNSADTTVTLPLVSGQIGMEYRITRLSAGAFKVYVAVQGGDTLNGGGASAIMSSATDSLLVIGTSTGWRALSKTGTITGI